MLSPQIHEAAGHLQFANPENHDDPGLGRYFGFVSQFDRSFDLADQFATFEAADKTWRFNRNPTDDGPSINYWKGKIRADTQDYDAYYEYNIPPVAEDDTGEEKINFQFRPALPEATHVDTGNRITSMPEDLPEGLRVQIQSANVLPDTYLEILRVLFQKLGVHTTFLDDVHPYSRHTGLVIHVRVDRAVREDRIVDRNDLLERLARFSAVRRGRGKWKWDNEEILGHRTAVALSPTALEKFYAGHAVGKLLKSYHMKNSSDDQEAVTYHPKLEVQWNKEHAPIESVHWSPDKGDPDRDDLLGEIETFLYHAHHWAGLTLTPDPEVYVADTYFTLNPTDRDLNLTIGPTRGLIEYEEELAVITIYDTDLTPKQKQTLRTLSNGGQRLGLSARAESAGVSESTVRRTIGKLSDIFTLSNGAVTPEDDVIAGKLQDIFYSIDHVLDRAKHSIHRLGSQREVIDENSTLGKWARRYVVTVDDTDPDAVEIAITLGELTEYQLVKIVRAGFRAANTVGSNAAYRFRNARIRYKTATGEQRTTGFGRFGHEYRFHGYPRD